MSDGPAVLGGGVEGLVGGTKPQFIWAFSCQALCVFALLL